MCVSSARSMPLNLGLMVCCVSWLCVLAYFSEDSVEDDVHGMHARC